METTELYYPQIAARAGPYSFAQGIEIEVFSAKSSYFDWAKIRFTGQFQPKITLNRKDPAAIQLGYNGVLDDVFTGYVAKPYDGGDYANEVNLKDEMLVLEETIISSPLLTSLMDARGRNSDTAPRRNSLRLFWTLSTQPDGCGNLAHG